VVILRIDLTKLEDGLKGERFQHIHSSDFGFVMKLAGFENYDVENDDIMIHKEIK